MKVHRLQSAGKKRSTSSPKNGKFLDRFSIHANAAHPLAVDPTGRLFVSDTSQIFVLDANGQTIRSLEAYQAFGITFDQEGELFIAARSYVLKHQLNF